MACTAHEVANEQGALASLRIWSYSVVQASNMAYQQVVEDCSSVALRGWQCHAGSSAAFLVPSVIISSFLVVRLWDIAAGLSMTGIWASRVVLAAPRSSALRCPKMNGEEGPLPCPAFQPNATELIRSDSGIQICVKGSTCSQGISGHQCGYDFSQISLNYHLFGLAYDEAGIYI